VIVGVCVLITYSTYSYNRGAFVAPVVALLAVYSGRVRRMSVGVLVALAVVGVLLLTGYRYYRTSDISLSQAVGSQSKTIIAHSDVNAELQITAARPKFTAFLLQETHYAKKLYYGSTLIASVLSPVPRLGRSFRGSNGTTLYNNLIYGDLGVQDQVLPLQGELFINIHQRVTSR
jgi:hypothetical protein